MRWWELCFTFTDEHTAQIVYHSHANPSEDSKENDRKRLPQSSMSAVGPIVPSSALPSFFPCSLITAPSIQCWNTPTLAHALNSSPAGTHTWVSGDSKPWLFLVAQVFQKRCQKSNFSDRFAYFFRPQFPLTVSVASARLRKYDPNLSNHEMRKMKLMTTYKELVQGNVHKQKLSNKKNWDRIQVYKGGNQCFKVQIAFFFLSSPPFIITLLQEQSRSHT